MPAPSTLSTAKHQDFELEVSSGVWPSDISGEVVFATPQNSRSLAYSIFDWGATCRLSLSQGSRGVGEDNLAWQVRSIETPGKRLFNRHPEVFEPGMLGFNSPFGAPNCANTAPLPWGDRLFATWDAGRPVELNPDTLEFVAEVGSTESWGGNAMPTDGVLPFIFSSAHPVADPERDCLWTVKLQPVMEPTFGMQPSVVRFDRADGSRVRYWPLEGISFSGSVHTVSQTRDWVILADSGNFQADPGEMMGGERTLTTNEESPLWLIRKDELEGLPAGTPVKPIPLTMAPPTGHYYARWDDTDGISVVWEGMDLMDLGLYMKADDLDVNGNTVDPGAVGLYNMAMAPETITEVIFDPNAKKVIERGIFKDDWTFNLQLSAMDWSVEGQSNPTLHHVTYQGCRPGNISQRAAKLYEGRIDLDQVAEDTPGALCSFERGSMELRARYEYSDVGDLITSPTFVPRDPGSSKGASSYAGSQPGGHDGYVVQPVQNDNGFRVDVFDAADVSAGPVATLTGKNKECVPLILHSAWMPQSTGGLADAERLSFSDDLTEEAMASVPQEFHGAIRDVAAECEELF